MENREPVFHSFHNRQAGIAAIIHGISFGICVSTTVITVALILLQSKLRKATRLAMASVSGAALVLATLYFVPNLSTQVRYFGGIWPMAHAIPLQKMYYQSWESPEVSIVVFQLITWLFAALMSYMVTASWRQHRAIGAASATVYIAIVLASLISLLSESYIACMILSMILFLFEVVAYDLILVRFVLNKRTVAGNQRAVSFEQLDGGRHIVFLIAGAGYIISRIFLIASWLNLGGSDIWASPIVIVSALLVVHLLILYSAIYDEPGSIYELIDEPPSSSGPGHV